jgi:hypothetical protein
MVAADERSMVSFRLLVCWVVVVLATLGEERISAPVARVSL